MVTSKGLTHNNSHTRAHPHIHASTNRPWCRELNSALFFIHVLMVDGHTVFIYTVWSPSRSPPPTPLHPHQPLRDSISGSVCWQVTLLHLSYVQWRCMHTLLACCTLVWGGGIWWDFPSWGMRTSLFSLFAPCPPPVLLQDVFPSYPGYSVCIAPLIIGTLETERESTLICFCDTNTDPDGSCPRSKYTPTHVHSRRFIWFRCHVSRQGM